MGHVFHSCGGLLSLDGGWDFLDEDDFDVRQAQPSRLAFKSKFKASGIVEKQMMPTVLHEK